jgi:DNA-binding GntR family transcriptional regulator
MGGLCALQLDTDAPIGGVALLVAKSTIAVKPNRLTGVQMSRPKKAQSQFLLARQIVAHMFENKFDKGHHLVETALAERFDVSRTLIRASLNRLAKESVVEPRPNQGFFLLKGWNLLNGGVISVPPSVEDTLYRRIVRDRISGKIPERITQVALIERYGADRGALLRALETMADEGIVTKNKGHGWTFLPIISTKKSVRNSYDFRRILEPSGMLLDSFRVDPVALDRLRAAHVALLAEPDTASGPHLFDLDAEFHETIASFTQNSFFTQAIQQQNRLRRLLEYRGYENRRRIRVWVREHLAVLDALDAKKFGRAAQLMTEHLDKAFRNATAKTKSADG